MKFTLRSVDGITFWVALHQSHGFAIFPPQFSQGLKPYQPNVITKLVFLKNASLKHKQKSGICQGVSVTFLK